VCSAQSELKKLEPRLSFSSQAPAVFACRRLLNQQNKRQTAQAKTEQTHPTDGLKPPSSCLRLRCSPSPWLHRTSNLYSEKGLQFLGAEERMRTRWTRLRGESLGVSRQVHAVVNHRLRRDLGRLYLQARPQRGARRTRDAVKEFRDKKSQSRRRYSAEQITEDEMS